MMGEQLMPAKEETNLILPSSREALLKKLNSLKTNNLTARENEYLTELSKETSIVFILLCYDKLDIRLDDLRKLEKKELEELACFLYEKTFRHAFLQLFF